MTVKALRINIALSPSVKFFSAILFCSVDDFLFSYSYFFMDSYYAPFRKLKLYNALLCLLYFLMHNTGLIYHQSINVHPIIRHNGLYNINTTWSILSIDPKTMGTIRSRPRY